MQRGRSQAGWSTEGVPLSLAYGKRNTVRPRHLSRRPGVSLAPTTCCAGDGFWKTSKIQIHDLQLEATSDIRLEVTNKCLQLIYSEPSNQLKLGIWLLMWLFLENDVKISQSNLFGSTQSITKANLIFSRYYRQSKIQIHGFHRSPKWGILFLHL